jgi:hypothetical protein
MRKLRDVFYINSYPQENYVKYYGMQLNEFIQCCPINLHNLLLIKSEIYANHFNSNISFQFLDMDEIKEYENGKEIGLGDFCFVNFNNEKNLDLLTPDEIAELLYLGHKFKPLKSPFFQKLNNQFTYLSHDDGWFCKLYCKDFNSFAKIIGNKIFSETSKIKRKKINPLDDLLNTQLLTISENGLLIDFCNTIKFERIIEIPIYAIGKFDNMDKMYNDLNKHIDQCKYSARLCYKKNIWSLY